MGWGGVLRSETIIEPPRGPLSLDLGELWRYRDLALLLVWRDVSASYRQSIAGAAWAILKPLVSMAVFTIVFGRVLNVPSDGVPYPVFAFAGLLPWMYFANCLAGSTDSVVGGGGLVNKVYFPRLVLPLASVVRGMVDFGVQLSVLAGLMLWFRLPPSPRILLLPVLAVVCALTALSVGVWLASLNVRYRDVGHAVPFFTQAWLWLTPVAYPKSIVPGSWQLLYDLNPMTAVVEAFRWTLLGRAAPQWSAVIMATTVVVVLLSTGLYYFRKTEASFADVI